ncbi:PRTRC system protein E [Paraburkholderia diazotrophica]|uniref:PRTRC system protein E n=1 Tax=Paraburkholderia diazotrophica TaxID=667676 RepID=A0A1H7EME9_9BURK|nr:PRTRC system protein E [Paraburkholderia diazotrophica]SEK12820.1 PRTRC system protein E [Paraburkholderia diazotrophica]
MFVELEALLKSCTTLKLSIKSKGDAMVVVVMPEGEAKDATLRQPLVMTASAAELDAGFAEHLATYTGAYASLAEQVAATTAILGEAQKTQVTKATKALSGKGSRSLPAPAQSSPGADEPDDDDDSDASDPDSGTAKEAETATAQAATEPASTGTDLASLF